VLPLLPPPHRHKWNWLIWLIILLGLLLLVVWLLRGCKSIAPAAEAEAPRAYYGKFDLLDNGPVVEEDGPFYSTTLPDGKVYFIANAYFATTAEELSAARQQAQSRPGVFSFDPATNQFQHHIDFGTKPCADIRDADACGVAASFLWLRDGRLAVAYLTPWSYDRSSEELGGGWVDSGLGARNLQVQIYDSQTGQPSEKIKLTPEPPTTTRLGYHPLMVEIPGQGILLSSEEYTSNLPQVIPGTISHMIDYFYDFKAQTLRQQERKSGLPTDFRGTTTLPISENEILLIDDSSRVYIFDSRTKTTQFRRRLVGSYFNVFPIPNTSLVWINNTDKRVTKYSSTIYLYNFVTNELYSRRVGTLPLKQGSYTATVPGGGSIPREIPEGSKTLAEIPNTSNQYSFQPLADGTILVTGANYRDIPWSYGLMRLTDGAWLTRANDTAPAEVDPASNYQRLNEQKGLTDGQIRAAIILNDGRVLYGGDLWFTYTPNQSRTAAQMVTPPALAAAIGQTGRWTAGGKLLVGEAEKTINDPEYSLPNDTHPKFGTPYALPDGRIFFANPVLETQYGTTTQIFATGVFGQIYNPATNRSQWVRSNILKGKKWSFADGIADTVGQVHFFDLISNQELIFDGRSGSLRIRSLKYDGKAAAAKTNLYASEILAGQPVAAENKILFFSGGSVGVFNIKTGGYHDLYMEWEAVWLKSHAQIDQDKAAAFKAGLPLFDEQCKVGDLQSTLHAIFPSIPSGTGIKLAPCGIDGSLVLGNHRLLLASSNRVKLYDYQHNRTEDLGTLKEIDTVYKLFRMTDGRAAIVGQGNGSGRIEIVNLRTKETTVAYSEPEKLAEITSNVWLLPNDRLFFGSEPAAVYDLQQALWLPAPEAIVNVGYAGNGLMFQTAKHRLVKIATRLDYSDYGKDFPTISGMVQNMNATILPADAVELFIPEAGPWSFMDPTPLQFSWWLSFVYLQGVQGLAGVVVVLTQLLRRRFLIPL